MSYNDVEAAFKAVLERDSVTVAGSKDGGLWTQHSQAVTWRRRAYMWREKQKRETTRHLRRDDPMYCKTPYDDIVIRIPTGAHVCVLSVENTELIMYDGKGERIEPEQNYSKEEIMAMMPDFNLDGTPPLTPEDLYSGSAEDLFDSDVDNTN